MHNRLRLLFKIFYNTFYTFLYIVLLGLLIITPADAIRQALANRQLYNVFMVAGTYLLTLLLAALIYASRIYTNRSVVAAIPKTWIPVEKGDVGKSVRKMILDGLNRSAIIAWDSRPRVSKGEPVLVVSEPEARDSIAKPLHSQEKPRKRQKFLRKIRTSAVPDQPTVAIPMQSPVWGGIEHPGWSSPFTPDLANLQYITVIQELPHLIEAKAVSLAPSDPNSNTSAPTPDLRAIELLQRPATMGLRDYITQLISLGVLPAVSPASTFLSAYEHARFSSDTLTESDFRELMRLFADILRIMTSLDPTILDNLDVATPSIDAETDIDDDASSKSTPVTPRSRSLMSDSASSRSGSGSEGTIRTAPSRRLATNGTSTGRSPSKGFSTAPATPRSRKERSGLPRTASGNSFAQTRGMYQPSSSDSLSSRSVSAESVIKLTPSSDRAELPYTLTLPSR